MYKYIRRIYLKLLYHIAYFKIKKFNKVILIDFDFTLILHDIEILKKEKKYSLNHMLINKDLVSHIEKNYTGWNIILFTARGYLSSKDVLFKLNEISSINFSENIFIGSTCNKIKLLNKLNSKNIILFDDLNDWNFKNNEFNNTKYEIPSFIEYYHPKSIK